MVYGLCRCLLEIRPSILTAKQSLKKKPELAIMLFNEEGQVRLSRYAYVRHKGSGVHLR